MRGFAAAAFSFAAGIFLAQYGLSAAFWRLGAAGLFLFLAVASFFVKKAWRKRAVLIFCAMSAALIYCTVFDALFIRPAQSYVGAVETVEMEAADYPQKLTYGARVTVRLREPKLLGIKAVYYGGEELLCLQPGNRITAQAAFVGSESPSQRAKGEFLLLKGSGSAVIRDGAAGSIRYLPQRFAKAFSDKVKELYSNETAGFMAAILMGNTEELSAKDRGALSEAGLWHVTAVSGLHCSFLISLLGFFVGHSHYKRKALLGIPLVVFYAAAVGGSPSVTRAAIMLLFVLIAPLFNRENDPLTALSAALGSILLANPYAAASVSLQLSFGAVLGLLLVTPKISAAFSAKGKICRFLISSFSATLGALAFTAPLCALYFNTFTLVTPLSNLLCLWAVSLAFSLGMLSVALGFLFLPLGRILAFGAALLARYVLVVADGIASIPYHAVYFTDDRMKCWFIYAYIIFALCFFLKKKRARRVAAAAVLVCCALILSVFTTRRESVAPPLTVTVLDVGQGQCVLLTSGKEAVVVDCGSMTAGADAGEIAAETLCSRGFYEVKTLIVTHLDEDHISGAQTLCARSDVKEIWIPVIAEEFDAADRLFAATQEAKISVIAGQSLTFGEAELTVYSPASGAGGNDGGLAVLCSAGDFDVLITGDMSQKTEEILLDQMPPEDIEVLLAGHHGADDASGERLLYETEPEAVIVSVGENAFGHPDASALVRMREAGCAVYRTDLQGSVTIKAN
ncbi:MAG: DNA internalization-related competence protein ComEC/Rec2 [Oscillospiraceae bacterium]|nr:DNA internalization-related competence protein ComEC/Rec2 [Oscillospiraceae bacterium]